MFSSALKIAFCGALLSFNLQCARQANVSDAQPPQTGVAQGQDASMTDKQSAPIVTEGQASLVQFPEPWIESEAGSEKKYLFPQWYEIRATSSHSPKHELLFAGMTEDGYMGETHADQTGEKPKESWYSVNLYAVSPDNAYSVRAASKQEWNQAEKVSSRPRKLFPNTLEDLKLKEFDYRGHKYSKSSEHWGTTLLSPGGRWLAIYSYSGKKTQGTFLGGDTPSVGDIYWDLYDAKNGKKVLSWHAVAVHSPALLDEGAVWIREEYFIVPFNTAPPEFVIGILSDK